MRHVVINHVRVFTQLTRGGEEEGEEKITLLSVFKLLVR